MFHREFPSETVKLEIEVFNYIISTTLFCVSLAQVPACSRTPVREPHGVSLAQVSTCSRTHVPEPLGVLEALGRVLVDLGSLSFFSLLRFPTDPTPETGPVCVCYVVWTWFISSHPRESKLLNL